MKYSIVLLSLYMIAGNITGQVVTVVDQEDFTPIELVTITSASPQAYAVTDAAGKANISDFKGSSAIAFRFIGYRTAELSYAEVRESGFIVYLSPTNITLDNVVISAVRWSQPSRSVPVRMSGLTSRDVALENPQTAADLLGSSDEVFIQKSQLGGGSPMIRGFSANRLLIAVDGVRMNTAIFRGGNLQNIISLDPFAIERTEILFGPGSVIYGSDAIGGVMSFRTLEPKLYDTSTPRLSGKATGRYASASNERTGHFDISAGWRKWAFVSSISHVNFDDLRMGEHGRDEYLRGFFVERHDGQDVVISNPDPLVQKPTGYAQTNLMHKVRFSPNDRWDLTYGIHHSSTTDLPRYDRLIRTRDNQPVSAEWHYGPQVWLMHNLGVEHQHESVFFDRLHFRLTYQFFAESRIDRDFNSQIRNRRIEEVDAYAFNADLVRDIKGDNKLYYGFEWIFNDVTSTGMNENIVTGISQAGPTRYPQSTWASYAAYASFMWQLSPKSLLQAGARYNRFALEADFDTTFYPFPFTAADIDNGALTGSLGLVHNPDERWNISVNLSTGFRAPNVDDVGKVFDSEPGSVVVPNPDLNAEYVYNAEIGLARVFENDVKADLAVYYTILDNALVRRDFTLSGMDSMFYEGTLSRVQAIQNAARATVYGIQAGLEIKLPEGFSISSRFNYQKGEEELDEGTTSPSRHAAPWFGATSLSFSAKKLKLDLAVQYSGEVGHADLPEEEKGKIYIYATDRNGDPYSPGWYTLDFKAIYQLTEDFSLSGGVENLTDQRYRPYSSGIVAPGKNFILSISAVF